MKIRSAIGSLILGAALAASFTLAAPAEAGVRIGVHVGIARPALRREVIAVRPSSHHVWVAGYWHWPEGGREWAWVGGAWTLPPHAHSSWVRPRYVRRDGEWFYTSGYWR